MDSKERKQTDIQYLSVLDYLEKNHGLYYKDPEKASPEDKKKFQGIKESGEHAKDEMIKMAGKLCDKEEFQLEKLPLEEQFTTIQWYEGSTIKGGTIKDNLWALLKYEGYEDNPIGIIICAEMSSPTSGKARYRFSLEIYNKKMDEKQLEKYYRPLPTDSSLVYMVSNDSGKLDTVQTLDEIKKKIQNEKYKRVQLCKVVDRTATDDDMEQAMFEAVKELISYYKYVIWEDENGFDKNIILYGPPGTGKTYNSAIYAVAFCDGRLIDDYTEVMARYNKLKKDGRIAFTTFHQSYGYEEFIEGIKPVTDEKTKDVSYPIEPGVFKKFCDDARNKKEPYVFIIDEINRGNISKIFGELITLIESTKREGMDEAMSAILPYSQKTFSVPSNVYILGTMNTADRSIALMDIALRRRFQFKEMEPDYDLLDKIKVEDVNVGAMLKKINERITVLYDKEHVIGHAFFTGLKDDPSIKKLGSIFQISVIPLLKEYFYEDYQKIQFVLGDNAKSDDKLKFIRDEKDEPENIFKNKSKKDLKDLPEDLPVRYSINSDAFGEIKSYKEIL